MQQEPGKVAALIDTVRAQDDAGVPHALIGGLAVGIHAAVPRRAGPDATGCQGLP